MRDERGSTTLWTMGLALALFMVGGLSLDLWRVLAERQDLANIADAGAVAAASGIDVEHFRDSGEKLLAPDLARELALAAIATQPSGSNLSAVITITSDRRTAIVRLERTVQFTLLNVFVAAKTGPFVVTVESRADARPAA